MNAVGKGMLNFIQKFFDKKHRTKRVEIRYVDYVEGDRLIREGWQLALPEEDHNRVFGMVYVERRVSA